MANRRRIPWVVLVVTSISTAVCAGTALAYDTYNDGSDGHCAACHGDFRAGAYTSFTDGTAWLDPAGDPTNLHDGHRQDMLSGECDACHSSGGRSPVYLNASRGGAGLDAISCVGCHGRAEDDVMSNPAVMAGYGGYGAGLRQHHDGAGVTACRGCHDDADPSAYTPVGEEVLPPYYTASTTSYPDMPQDSCNPGGTESRYGADGLDNDGDDFYDDGDTDCTAVVDAGVDAGPPDAGFDAGPPDAGPSDAGFDGGAADAGAFDAAVADAGAVLDGGAADAGAPDAGEGVDSGPGRDAGPSSDAGMVADAAPAIDAGGDESPSDDGGCSCSAPGAAGPTRGYIGAALLALLLWRRRRR